MDVNICYTNGYENKCDWTLGENKPNQTQFFTPLFRALYTLRGPVLRPLFPDEAVFSFDLVARPVILNANIRQLRRPMEREHI